MVTHGIMTILPIGITHPRITALAEASATRRSRALAVISNTAMAERATTTIINTRATGVATVTMTTEAAIDHMMIGVATVATKTVDGNDTEM